MSEIFLGRPVHRNSPADYERSTPGSDIAGSVVESSIPGYSLFKKAGDAISNMVGGGSSKPAIKHDEFIKAVKAKGDADQKRKEY
jgi:hypothetical protein